MIVLTTEGVQDIYGTQSLGLCPSTPNCISTAEEANMSEDVKGGRSHYVPQWYEQLFVASQNC